ncbi:hypothetical protein ACK8HY_13615, partial [Sphingobacterium sp. NGMCC 1.201703]|uniref:hypothetical protein n=1 Tax=Sphingobacterium sp. NGMCC 1.201703 TaxID=3388657 RepID=UPI0039FBF29C
RSVPFFTRKPLLETVKGFFRLHTFAAASLRAANRAGWGVPHSHIIPATGLLDNRLGARATGAVKPTKP